jgi:hypothetical protein
MKPLYKALGAGRPTLFKFKSYSMFNCVLTFASAPLFNFNLVQTGCGKNLWHEKSVTKSLPEEYFSSAAYQFLTEFCTQEE